MYCTRRLLVNPTSEWPIIGLLLRPSQRRLAREHHRGSASAKPGVAVRAFGTDNASYRHEHTAVQGRLANETILRTQKR